MENVKTRQDSFYWQGLCWPIKAVLYKVFSKFSDHNDLPELPLHRKVVKTKHTIEDGCP